MRRLGPGEKVSLHTLAETLGRRAQSRPSRADAPRLRRPARGQVSSRLLRDAAHRGGGRGGLRRSARARATGSGARCRPGPARRVAPFPRAGGRDGGHRCSPHAEWDMANAAFHEAQVDLAANRLLSRFYRELSINLMMQVIRGGEARGSRTCPGARRDRRGLRGRRPRRGAGCDPRPHRHRSQDCARGDRRRRRRSLGRSISSVARTEDARETDSGIEIEPVYGEGAAGRVPFTRGPCADMYRGRPWTIRQAAGFGSAEETNARFRYLLRARSRPGSRSPSTCRHSSATTRTTRTPSARSACQGRDRLDRGHAPAAGQDPARRDRPR